MAVNPNTPGVYIDEIPVFPASVAGVNTAIPAFIGYVQKAERGGEGIVLNTPVRITSLLEYETIFGKGQAHGFSMEIDYLTATSTRNITVTKSATGSDYKLYYNMQMYFANGGGPCYIIPVGLYSATGVVKQSLLDGLTVVKQLDEPTLLVVPDAISLVDADLKEVYDLALAQCELLKDRFVIMDVKTGSSASADATAFRTNCVGINSLKYGAAYYPYLNTTLRLEVDENMVLVTAQKQNGTTVANSADLVNFLTKVETAINETQRGFRNARICATGLTDTSVTTFANSIETAVDDINTAFDGKSILDKTNSALSADTQAKLTSMDAAINTADTYASGTFKTASTTYDTTTTKANADAMLAAYNNLLSQLLALRTAAYVLLRNADYAGFTVGSLAGFKTNNPVIYNEVITKINSNTVTLNPSGVMAGVYARVDAERGVWKAPANLSVNSIIGPYLNVSNADQDGLNVDPNSGKSINVIRSFTGRGTMVWGARTLAGNSNEWRYVNVRRFFNYVEESVQKATGFVVFEPNTASTWLRVKGMIESFLTNLWREGALAGASTKEAFFVNVGLGTTMTADDVLNGRMIVEIGMAAARPAEFIILKFEHKLQES